MRDIKNKLTSGKNTKNIKNRKGKSFGYQVLGFGAGGSVAAPVDVDYLVIAGGGGGGRNRGGGGGSGGYRTSFPGGTKITLDGGDTTITVGGGGAGAPTPSPGTGTDGDDSVVGSITSTGGGGGGSLNGSHPDPVANGRTGGSGGGGGSYGSGGPALGGAGNTPPT